MHKTFPISNEKHIFIFFDVIFESVLDAMFEMEK